jgi:hypothetical protein
MATIQSVSFADLMTQAVNVPGTISRAYTAFHGYSIGNRLLAMFQCAERNIEPGPIATFMGWKDKGRYVRKGEKAIVLCMPVTNKRKADPDDPEADDVTFTRFVYRPNWFVLAQTDGDALAALETPDWDAQRALTVLGITETPFTSTDGNCQGYAYDRTIAVSPVAAMPYKTRFHEIAHIMLGHTTESAQTDSEHTPRSLREVEAECVALVCLEALGLPGAEFSRGYIQNWNAGSEPIPERSAQRIFKAADAILEAGNAVEAEA